MIKLILQGIKIHYKPKFKENPIIIAALPDMGNVAGLCQKLLLNKIETKTFLQKYLHFGLLMLPITKELLTILSPVISFMQV